MPHIKFFISWQWDIQFLLDKNHEISEYKTLCLGFIKLSHLTVIDGVLWKRFWCVF